jgi:hypothetical protein
MVRRRRRSVRRAPEEGGARELVGEMQDRTEEGGEEKYKDVKYRLRDNLWPIFYIFM